MSEQPQVPAEEIDLGLDEDEDAGTSPRTDGSKVVSPDDPDDPARAPETLGIDNTDTALGAEDDSAPVE